jgi:hypothetical protein
MPADDVSILPDILKVERDDPDLTGSSVNNRAVCTPGAAPPQRYRVVSGEVRAESSLPAQLGAEDPGFLRGEHRFSGLLLKDVLRRIVLQLRRNTRRSHYLNDERAKKDHCLHRLGRSGHLT